MCLILDASCYSAYLEADSDSKNVDMKLVRQWVENGGRMVYSPTEKIKQEMDNSPNLRKLLLRYRREGKVKMIDKDAVDAVQKKLSKLASDDPHIIALAIAGKVKLLISDDKNLRKDFKKIARGSIYRNKSHIHLLNKHTCKS